MKTFAERLNAAIDATGETQQELARAANLNREWVSKLCGGDATPSRIESRVIAEFLNCDHGWLHDGTPVHNPLLIRELELASMGTVGGVVTLQPDDYRRIYTLACMGRS